MDDPYRPIDFSAISGYPHVIPENGLQKLPCFQGSNVVDARVSCLQGFSLLC
jgi:hypothetical protein